VRAQVPARRGAALSVRGRVAIVGAAETDELGVIPGKSALQLHAEAAIKAIRDSGVDPSEIDGFAAAGADSGSSFVNTTSVPRPGVVSMTNRSISRRVPTIPRPIPVADW